MSSRTLPRTLLLLVTAAAVLLPIRAHSASRLLIVHSYEQGHVCGQPQHDGLVSALEREGFDIPGEVVVDAWYMDTKRLNNTTDLIRAQADRVLDKVARDQPDVLVTLDDNAFRTVGLELAGSGIPVVFSGMNGQPEAYHEQRHFLDSRERPGHNITGVYEKLHVVDAFRVHARMFPNVGTIRVLLDRSPTGRAIARQIELELGETSPPVRWDARTVSDWRSFQEEIRKTDRDEAVGAVYLATLLLKDEGGRTYTAPEIFRWTVENFSKPEIAINYAFTRLGLFGGAAVDFHAMGAQAGRMVVRILRGEPVGGIPLEDAKKFALVFNMQRARQLGIHIPSDILMAADEVVNTAR
jgi:hypothetical protein